MFSPSPIPGSTFGAQVLLEGRADLETCIDALESDPGALPATLHAHHGLLVLPGLSAISARPELLLRLSRLFGSEVEDYRETLTDAGKVHPQVPEIFVVANALMNARSCEISISVPA